MSENKYLTKWKFLINILKTNKINYNYKYVFKFEIFFVEINEDLAEVKCILDNNFILKIVLNNGVENVSHITGFDNTGNIRIWPSEELLGIYLLNNMQQFKDTAKVCEVGGGMTCFSALCLALNTNAQVLLTDGNERCVSNINNILNLNQPNLSNCEVGRLVWNDLAGLKDKWKAQVDLLLCSDCFFNVKSHMDLLTCLDKLLAPNGQCIMSSESRGGTLEKFLSAAKNYGFFVKIDDQYYKQFQKKSMENLEPIFIIHLRRSNIVDKAKNE